MIFSPHKIPTHLGWFWCKLGMNKKPELVLADSRVFLIVGREGKFDSRSGVSWGDEEPVPEVETVKVEGEMRV